MVQSRNLASGAGEKLRREHVPAAAGARSGEGQPSGTQGYDDLARLAVVRLGRRCRGIEQSVRSPMKLRSFPCEWRGTSSPFFQVHVRDHHPLARDQAPRDPAPAAPSTGLPSCPCCALPTAGRQCVTAHRYCATASLAALESASPSVFGICGPPKRLNHQAKCIRHDHALRHADRDLIPTLE